MRPPRRRAARQHLQRHGRSEHARLAERRGRAAPRRRRHAGRGAHPGAAASVTATPRSCCATSAGPTMPQAWQGGLPFRYHVGPGPVTRARDGARRPRDARHQADLEHGRHRARQRVSGRDRADRRASRFVERRRRRQRQRHGERARGRAHRRRPRCAPAGRRSGRSSSPPGTPRSGGSSAPPSTSSSIAARSRAAASRT